MGFNLERGRPCDFVQTRSQVFRQIGDFVEAAKAAMLKSSEKLAPAIRGFAQRFDERDQFRLTQPGSFDGFVQCWGNLSIQPAKRAKA